MATTNIKQNVHLIIYKKDINKRHKYLVNMIVSKFQQEAGFCCSETSIYCAKPCSSFNFNIHHTFN